MDGTGPVPQGPAAGPPAHSEDLGDDRPRHLLGPFGAEVEPRRSVHPVEGAGVDRHAGRLQVVDQALEAGPGPQHPQVGRGPGQEGLQVVAVAREVVAHHHHTGALVDTDLLGDTQGFGPDPAGGAGEALGAEQRRSVVHHHHLPTQPGRELHQGDGVAAGAAHHQPGRRPEHLDEGPVVAVDGDQSRGAGGQRLEGQPTAGGVEVVRAEAALDPTIGTHHDPGARRRALGHRDHRRGLVAGGRRPQRGDQRLCPLGRFDEHVDGAVAAQAPAPQRLVVGGEVEVQQAGLAVGHHLPGRGHHVAFQAAAGDVADGLAVGGHHQARPRPAVGRALHRDDGGQRRASSP